jgi:hypothetical protein
MSEAYSREISQQLMENIYYGKDYLKVSIATKEKIMKRFKSNVRSLKRACKTVDFLLRKGKNNVLYYKIKSEELTWKINELENANL